MYFEVPFEPKQTNWKDFENATGDVFERFGYKVLRNINFKTTRRFQIDLIAYDDKRCFFIDCKDHMYVAPSKEEEFLLKQEVRAKNFVKTKPELGHLKKITLLVTRNKTDSLMNHSETSGKIYGVDFKVLKDLLNNIHVYEAELKSF